VVAYVLQAPVSWPESCTRSTSAALTLGKNIAKELLHQFQETIFQKLLKDGNDLTEN
jgi:hypothetical protein